MALVRQSLAQAGYHLRYSRRANRPGYYIEGRPLLDEPIRRLIAPSIAEVDQERVLKLRNLTPAQRVQHALALNKTTERVATYNLMLRYPDLNEEKAKRMVRAGIRDYAPFEAFGWID